MHPLSIIIPVLNEEDYLPGLLQSIVDQQYPDTYEVIVVDGGSTDRTKQEALRFKDQIPSLRFLSYQRGTAKQRNYGAKAAKHHSLIFVDGDMQLAHYALSRIRQHFETKKHFVAIPRLLPYDGNLIDRLFAVLGNFYFILVRKTHPVTSGMCIITTKQTHDDIGGFNESLKYAEDIDYGMRAFRRGHKYFILSDVTVRSSTRRLEKVGRLTLGVMWLRWHRITYKHGAQRLQRTTNYEFGKFSKRRGVK